MTPNKKDALLRLWDEIATRQMREEVGPSEEAARSVNALTRAGGPALQQLRGRWRRTQHIRGAFIPRFVAN